MRAVLCLLFIMITTPACAGWMNMEETDSDTQYIDPDTVTREGDLRKVWQLSDRKKAGKDGVMSLRILLEFLAVTICASTGPPTRCLTTSRAVSRRDWVRPAM